MRLIDADDFRSWLVKAGRFLKCQDDKRTAAHAIGKIIEHMDKMPTTEAEPVVHAYWEKSEYRGFVRCSACKDAYIDEDWLTSGKWSGCPNCRAKMDMKPPEGGQHDAGDPIPQERRWLETR